MPRYRFEATDADGRRHRGEAVADDGPEALARRLEAEGLRVEELVAVEDAGGGGGGQKLSGAEVADFTRHLAGLTAAGVALPSGLRALGEELPRGPLRAVLADVAARLEEGLALDEAIARQGDRFPAHLRGLVLAGLRSGRLGEVLGEYVRYEQVGADLRRRLWLNLAYPIALLTAMAALLVFLSVVVVKQYAEIFADFGVDLPAVTVALIRVGWLVEQAGWGLMLAPLGLVVLLWLAGRGLFGPRTRRRVACRIPLIGPLWRWTALTEFSHLLALLLECRMPLPAALPLAGDGVRDADLSATCRAAAGDLEAGQPLAVVVGRRRLFPPGFGTLFRWAEKQQALPEALHLAGEMFAVRARAQASFVSILVLVVVVLLLIWGIGFIVAALYLPLFRLLNVLAM